MNMHDINLNSWEEFETQLRELEADRLAKKSASQFIYRGQSDRAMHLLLGNFAERWNGCLRQS